MNGANENVKTSRGQYENILKNNLGGLEGYSEEIEDILKSGDEWPKETPMKSLTPEQEKKLKRYDDFNFAEVPDDWKTEHDKLLKNQEKHTDADLKPANLPSDWEKQIKDTEALKEDKKNLQKSLSEEKKAKEQAQAELGNWANAFKGEKPEVIKAKYDEVTSCFGGTFPNDFKNKWETLEKRPDINITKEQWDSDWSKRKPLADYNKVKSDLDEWTAQFPNKSAQDIQTELKAGGKPADYDTIKVDLEAWKTAFHGKSVQQVKQKYKDRKTRIINLLEAISTAEQKELQEESQKS